MPSSARSGGAPESPDDLRAFLALRGSLSDEEADALERHVEEIRGTAAGGPSTATPSARRPPGSTPPTVRDVDPDRLLRRLARGDVANGRFADLVGLLEALGFRLARVSGSHHVFTHPRLPELISVQRVRGKAKPYQVRQVLRLVERHGLRLAGDPGDLDVEGGS